MIKKFIVAVSLVGCGSGGMQAAAQVNQCAVLLNGGAFETTDFNTDQSSYVRLARWMCDNQSNSSDTKIAGSVTDLADGFGASGDNQRREAWMKSFCSSTDYTFQTHNINKTKIQKASETLVSGFNDCMRSQQPGVWLGYVPGASDQQYVVKLGYRWVRGMKESATVNIEGAKQAGCDVSPTVAIKAEATQSLLCQRPAESAKTVVLKNADVLILNGQISVPAKILPPKCNQPDERHAGMTVDLVPSPCIMKVKYYAQGTFQMGRDTGHDNAEILQNGNFINNVGTGDWNNAIVSWPTTPGEVLLQPGRQTMFTLHRTSSLNSNPIGMIQLIVTVTYLKP